MLEESEQRAEIDQAQTHEDRNADCAIWVNYRRMVCQTENEIDGQEHGTVRMPHWGDEAHLGRVQGKVLGESQRRLEDSSFTMTRGKIRYNWTSGTLKHSLECVGWPENALDRKRIITPRTDIAGSRRTR